MDKKEKKSMMDIPIITERLSTQKYQAVCNGHIGGWYGTCYENRSDALTDATNHDNSQHGGEHWAVVVRRTCD
ncbi:hypothetical protein [Bacillus subtilis]|uniref:hypothetical protein n=1 Tax=Bacillus subtilis TaxID=1423 RepID=UPI002A6994C0|nr:hypothetical protein [Bacillus subtilis]WPP26255.1 hypothetical protein SIS06_03495 [Bacillus subtilis]